MNEPLDPYRKWLGIRDPDRPPNHYRLLGLEPFEEDRETIANAADRQMSHVRNYQVGPHAALSQRLLNDLAAARICLLDTAKKAAYDARLRQAIGSSSGSTLEPAEDGIPAIVADSPSGAMRRAKRQRPSAVLPVVGLCATLLIVLAVAYALLTREMVGTLPKEPDPAPVVVAPLRPAKPVIPTPRPREEREQPRLPPLSERPSPNNMEGEEASPLEVPETRETMPDPPTSAAENLATEMAFVRNALATRDLSAAAERLQALDSTELSPEQQQALGRLQTLHDILAGFWEKAQTAVDRLRPGDELIVDETPYAVADVQGNALVLQSQLRRVQFDRSLLPRLLDLPYGFVIALAERGYAPGDPQAKLGIGTFLAFDRYGEPEQARQYWEEAARSGVVVAEVLAEWDLMRRGETIPTASSGRKEEERAPLPSEGLRQEALKKVKEVHAGAMTAARTVEEKRALGGELLRQGLETRDAAEARYVLLEEARTWALAGDDVETALRAAEELGRSFELDGLEEQAAVLDQALKKSRGKEVLVAVAKLAESLMDEAVAEDRFELARRLNQMALAAAQRAREGDLVRVIVAEGRKVQGIEQQFEKARSALDTLKSAPEDAEASTTWGLYQCLDKDNWLTGVPLLAQSQDNELRGLAERELARPFAPDERIQLADGWWDYAQGAGKGRRDAFLARAAHWYEQALPFVSGLTRAHVETRLADIYGTGGRAGQRSRQAMDTAAVSVRRLQMVPLSAEYGWRDVPVDLNGAFVFAGNRIRQDAEGGILEFQVVRSGPVFLAVTWTVDGNLGGEWSQAIVKREQLLAEGWKPVGGVMLGNESHELLRRDVKSGDTFKLRTRKYSPPYLIVAGTGAAGSTTVPD